VVRPTPHRYEGLDKAILGGRLKIPVMLFSSMPFFSEGLNLVLMLETVRLPQTVACSNDTPGSLTFA
jgi:hypothetical protein